MLVRKPVFPHVIEINHQLGQRLGCNVYLVFDGPDWVLIDIGFEDTVDEIVELVRQLDFPLSRCQGLIATHADVDHVQGMAKLKAAIKAPILGHESSVEPLRSADLVRTYAEIAAQDVHLPMPPIVIDKTIADGETLKVGNLDLEVWHTPGHTEGQLAFRLGNLLLSGDNIYRDGAVGVIDAHHGSHIPDFIRSLQRIAASDVEWLLPSHGPIFRKDNAMIARTIARLQGYLSLADFGTCATSWPLMEEFEAELSAGKMPR